jgi:predicted DNA-binding transcriptional regulator AlpA
MKSAGNDDEFLLIEEAAALTRQTVSTLRWLRHQGKGPPAVKLGRRLVFRRAAVLAWISELERQQSDARLGSGSGRLGTAKPGRARKGLAWHGSQRKAWQGEARQG